MQKRSPNIRFGLFFVQNKENFCIYAKKVVPLCTFYACDHMTPTNERQSNAELLRIICILAILLHHFCVHALYPEIDSLDIIGTGWDKHFILFNYAFIYLGVNCFILISGWFGIKPSWRGFLNMYLICIFYNLLASYNNFFSQETLVQVFLPFTHGKLWFIKCYFKLFLIAPLLNPAIQYLNKRYYAFLIVLIGAASLYYDTLWVSGYSLPHFVYLYLIGGFLRRFVSEERMSAHRWYYFGAYVAFGLAWGACTVATVHGHAIPYWQVWNYNNPVLMLTAVAFFLFMMSWKFQSQIINRLAMSTLAVYMLNEAVVKYDFLTPYAHAFNAWAQIAIWIGVTVAFYILAVGIDQIRIFITQPILKRIK